MVNISASYARFALNQNVVELGASDTQTHTMYMRDYRQESTHLPSPPRKIRRPLQASPPDTGSSACFSSPLVSVLMWARGCIRGVRECVCERDRARAVGSGPKMFRFGATLKTAIPRRDVM